MTVDRTPEPLILNPTETMYLYDLVREDIAGLNNLLDSNTLPSEDRAKALACHKTANSIARKLRKFLDTAAIKSQLD